MNQGSMDQGSMDGCWFLARCVLHRIWEARHDITDQDARRCLDSIHVEPPRTANSTTRPGPVWGWCEVDSMPYQQLSGSSSSPADRLWDAVNKFVRHPRVMCLHLASLPGAVLKHHFSNPTSMSVEAVITSVCAAGCGKDAMGQCRACNKIGCCSRECQKAHWKLNHRHSCCFLQAAKSLSVEQQDVLLTIRRELARLPPGECALLHIFSRHIFSDSHLYYCSCLCFHVPASLQTGRR